MQSKGLSRVLQLHSSKASILWRSAFFRVQLSHPYMTTGKTIALTRWIFVGKVMSLLFNTLSRLVTAFLPRSKRLLISWLQSPSAVILEPRKIKSLTVSVVSPSICCEVDGTRCHDLLFSECRALGQKTSPWILARLYFQNSEEVDFDSFGYCSHFFYGVVKFWRSSICYSGTASINSSVIYPFLFFFFFFKLKVNLIMTIVVLRLSRRVGKPHWELSSRNYFQNHTAEWAS